MFGVADYFFIFIIIMFNIYSIGVADGEGEVGLRLHLRLHWQRQRHALCPRGGLSKLTSPSPSSFPDPRNDYVQSRLLTEAGVSPV